MRTSLFLTLLFSAFCLPASFTEASEAGTKPVLRLETGMHTAMVKRIGVDRAGRYLVSASDDKTLRPWSLPDLSLLKTLRVPIGAGHEGKLYATAISPDAQWIAAGGWSSDDSIYLFNRQTGQLQHRIKGLGNVILHLAFSPDGRYLAASLGAGGMRVWHSSDWSQVGKDTEYGSDSYWCDFSRDGRLITSSVDGYLRLYDRHFKLQKKRKAAGGNQPFSAVFSPDGRAIAVGFYDSTVVNVLDADTLALRYIPDTRGVNKGNLSSVAWADGALYAGGSAGFSGFDNPIRRWADAGRGSYRDLPVSAETIMDIRPLPAGGVAIGSADPAIILLDEHGNKAQQRLAKIADFRDDHQGFLASQDGMQVKFGFEQWGRASATFNLTQRQITLSPSSTASMQSPDTNSLNIKDWKYTTHPTLNGQTLKLGQYETSRSLAIAPDTRSFVLGAAWSLRCFDSKGRELWQQSVPSEAWGVNISGNGKLAIAAFGDGTIRWYRYSDGKLLLSFFPHKDGKRWVVWTPSGYYDASAGAESLIGWHLNRGKDHAAAFYPVSKFRSQFYRPDVVVRILMAGSEAEAIKLADATRGRKTQQVDLASMVPPDISILSPESGSTFSGDSVVLRYALHTPSGEPVTGVRALVDGRPVVRERGMRIKAKGDQGNGIRVALPHKDVTIALLAENRFATSEPAIIRLHWRGKRTTQQATGSDAFIIKPKLYVLAVGISQYADQQLKLGLPDKDARDFSAMMRKQKGKLYRDVVVKTLTNADANGDAILDGLDWLTRQTTSLDVAMLFLAGHGVNDNEGDYYFLPYDVNVKRIRRTGVPFYEIKKTLKSLAGKSIFFVDSCHSGNVMGGRRGVADINAVINELASVETGSVVFSASTGNQSSLEDPSWGNGAFTKAVLEGLSGKADAAGSGRITINMLTLYISERVKQLTHGEQTPVTEKPNIIPDFPIAVH